MLLVILARSAVRVSGVEWWPFLIRDDADVIGVVGVADRRARHGSLDIFHLLIDQHHQGQGHGRAALQRLVELGQHASGCQATHLTVNPENTAAIALYRLAHSKRQGPTRTASQR